MANIKYHVALSEEDREILNGIIRKGESPARRITRAHILLAIDENAPAPLNAEAAAHQCAVHPQTVHTVRMTYATQGLEAVLERKKIQGKPRKVTGDVEARIIALCLSEPPEGQDRWTLRLVAEEAVRLKIVASFSHTGVKDILKKTNLSLT